MLLDFGQETLARDSEHSMRSKNGQVQLISLMDWADHALWKMSDWILHWIMQSMLQSMLQSMPAFLKVFLHQNVWLAKAWGFPLCSNYSSPFCEANEKHLALVAANIKHNKILIMGWSRAMRAEGSLRGWGWGGMSRSEETNGSSDNGGKEGEG